MKHLLALTFILLLSFFVSLYYRKINLQIFLLKEMKNSKLVKIKSIFDLKHIYELYLLSLGESIWLILPFYIKLNKKKIDNRKVKLFEKKLMKNNLLMLYTLIVFVLIIISVKLFL